MIYQRPCSKSSAFYKGSNRYFCSTHNHDMSDSEYRCQFGDLEGQLISQLNPILNKLDERLDALETHFTNALKTFAANLEKLHERDPPT